MKEYEFKLIGKPLGLKKQEVLFKMLNTFMNNTSYQRLEDDDWQILGEQCGVITVQNKHTFEIFEFAICGKYWED